MTCYKKRWGKFKDFFIKAIVVGTFIIIGLSLLFTLKFLSSLEYTPGPRGLVWVDNKPYIIAQTSIYGGYAYPAGKYNEDPIDKVRLK